MDTTFITIHDLTDEARILYASDSIVDILGHTPDEVVNRSCWEFFHPSQVPIARQLHSRGVHMDKAAVLAYCELISRDGSWVNCECCFSVVYNVLVVCTSVYRSGMASQKRAVEAPIVRRLFSSSPNDPRYHMLSHLSTKFKQPVEDQTHEPRAALFLNRFTRTLTIMYATSGIEQVIGIPSEDMKGKSFYYCIAENCLEDAVKCLETAKSNDSIAYLRFWFRDPRQDDHPPQSTSESGDTDASMTDVSISEDDEDGGVHVRQGHQRPSDSSGATTSPESSRSDARGGAAQGDPSRISSGNNLNPASTAGGVFGGQTTNSTSSISTSLTSPESGSTNSDAMELEAVVSCTSDGLVVCLRRARPLIPQIVQDLPAVQPQQPQTYANGLFAAPWGPNQPTYYGPPQPQPGLVGPYTYFPGMDLTYAPAANVQRGPAQIDLMNSIREVAVFAWALTGINGSLADYAVGKAGGESQPPEGFPVWDPYHKGNDSSGAGSTTAVSNTYSSLDGSLNGKQRFSGLGH